MTVRNLKACFNSQLIHCLNNGRIEGSTRKREKKRMNEGYNYAEKRKNINQQRAVGGSGIVE